MELVSEYFMAILLFFSFITLIFYGFPVAWTMGGLAVIFTLISMLSDTYLDTFFGVDWKFASMVVYRLYGVMANWVLVALPMFILMGILMDKSGIAEDLMTDLSKLFGRMRGGLAISVVFIGVLLAASTGIIGAAVVLLTILGVPLMLKNNYSPDLACGVVCATGTLGILIPPSIMLVIMGDQVRVSVGDLFMGIATPTEASGLGAFGAWLLAIARGRLSFQDLKSVIRKTTHTTSYIFALFVGATMFALVLRGLGGDELIEGALKGLPFGPNGVVIVVLFITFLLGFFLDWIEITLIILPFLTPVMLDLGVDLVWFIIMFDVVLQTSFITPPVGFALFYMKGVAPQGITIQNIYRGIIPFVILQVIAVAIVFNFPKIVTWLPQVAYGP